MKLKTKSWLAILCVFTTILYFLSLNNEFINFDDDIGITTNSAIKDFSTEGVFYHFKHFTLGMYMPLTMTCYVFLHKIALLNGSAYHSFQLFVHLMNTLLVFQFLKKLQSNEWIALLVAAAFAIHPLQVESVSWVAALSTPLYACFYLLGLIAYLDFQEKNTKKTYLLVILCMILACLSKSAAVTFTVSLLLIDFYKEKNIFNIKVWLEKIPFFALSIAFGVLTFFSRNSEGSNFEIATKYNLFDRFLMVCHTLCFYWLKLLVPTKILLWYPFYKENNTWSVDYYLAPLALAALAYFIFFKSGKWKNSLIFGFGFYCIVIGLSLPYVKTGAAEMCSDRYNYLPMLGFFFVVATFLNEIKEKNTAKIAVSAMIIIWGLYYSYMTFTHAQVWKNSETLFGDYISKNPKEPTPFFNRGLYYMLKDNFTKAENDFNQVLKLDASYFGDTYRRGYCRMELKRYEEAIKDFDASLKENPNQTNALMYRGFSNLQLARFQQAVNDYDAASKLNPSNESIFYHRGLSYAGLNQTEKAIEDYQKAIALKPDYTEAYINMGNLYGMIGQAQKAIEQFDKAIQISQNFPNAYANRAYTYFGQKMYQKAIEDFTKAIQLNPNYGRAYQGRAMAYKAIGEEEKANQDLMRLK